jgi:hypothetical protein
VAPRLFVLNREPRAVRKTIPPGGLFTLASSSTHLEGDDNVLHVITAVDRQGLWNNEEGVSERLDAQLDTALGFRLDFVREVRRSRDLERASAGDERAVLESVLDGAEAVAQPIVDLSGRVCVGAWSKERHQSADAQSITPTEELRAPLISRVTLLGFLTSSMNVYFSSPSVCS